MSNKNPPFVFEIITTSDQSPTLSLWGGEKMHSLEGALSESLYIYSPCIEFAFKKGSPRILSMGLGLGYNEILSFAWAEKYKTNPEIRSFEIVPELRAYFLNWLEGTHSPLNTCYELILQQISNHFHLDSQAVKNRSLKLLKLHQFEIFQEAPLPNPFGFSFNSILYDAFSSKTSPALWTNDFLESFIYEYCDKECSLSTYASTGNLKRTLKESGFQLHKKKGFGKKRESTLALRNYHLS